MVNFWLTSNCCLTLLITNNGSLFSLFPPCLLIWLGFALFFNTKKHKSSVFSVPLLNHLNTLINSVQGNVFVIAKALKTCCFWVPVTWPGSKWRGREHSLVSTGAVWRNCWLIHLILNVRNCSERTQARPVSCDIEQCVLGHVFTAINLAVVGGEWLLNQEKTYGSFWLM